MSAHTHTSPARLLRAGTSAIIAEYSTLEQTMAAFEALERDVLEGIIELVPAAKTILVRFDFSIAPAVVARWINAPRAVDATAGIAARSTVTIDVVYDGDDLDDVAHFLGVSSAGVIETHTSTDYRVAFTGFAPGFAYLAATANILNAPRRSSPRPRVAPGSVGLAGEFSGIYPRATPGGWQIIGRTNAELWNDNRAEPALLRAGMAVSFRAVREQAHIAPSPQSQAKTTSHTGTTVVTAAPQLTLQDHGRLLHAAEGVTTSGALDRASHNAANDAVGNTPDAATMEIAFGGAVLRLNETAVLALTGANMRAYLVDDDDSEIDLTPGEPFLAAAGSTLHVGWATHGTRAYLAVRGGWASTRSVGSRSTDTLSGLGPAPLVAGDTVAILPTSPTSRAVTSVSSTAAYVASGETTTLDVTLGPRDEWFTPAALDAFQAQEWAVSALSDRVGARLEGKVGLTRLKTDELPSEPVVRGSIQVPSNGQPVIFLADHPVTGGYPVIAVIVPEHCDRAGQLPPGARVRFRVRTLA